MARYFFKANLEKHSVKATFGFIRQIFGKYSVKNEVKRIFISQS